MISGNYCLVFLGYVGKCLHSQNRYIDILGWNVKMTTTYFQMIVYICIFLHSNCLKMWLLKTTTTYFYLSLCFRNLNRDQLIHSAWHWLGSPVLLIQLLSGLDWKVLEGFTPTSGSSCSFMWFSLSPHDIIAFIYQSWAYFYLQYHGLPFLNKNGRHGESKSVSKGEN